MVMAPSLLVLPTLEEANGAGCVGGWWEVGWEVGTLYWHTDCKGSCLGFRLTHLSTDDRPCNDIRRFVMINVYIYINR